MPDAQFDMEDYVSPGRAFARQARMEHIIVTLMGRSMKRFLAEVATLAAKWGAGLSPVAVEDAWREEIERALKSPLLSADAVVYVHDAMIDSTIPVEAYGTVVTVYRAASEQHWADDETKAILQFSLSPDTASANPVAPTLTAAASLSKTIRRAEKLKTAIENAVDIAQGVDAIEDTLRNRAIIAGISYAGQTWWEQMRAEAHDAVTGLEGHLTQTVLNAFVQQYEDTSPETKKRWVTRRDKKVRDTHHAANGQTVPVNQAFQVGDSFLMYPGDRSGSVEEIANCRCIMVAVGPRLRDSKGRFKAIPKAEPPRSARRGS